MVRFFVANDMLCREEIILSGENAAHAKVLRLKSGDQVVVCDGCGMEAVCQVISAGQEYFLKRGMLSASKTEANVKVSVYMALPKSDKLEHVIQKATELGAFEIVTFPASRSVSKLDEKTLKKKLDRWQKIASSAAEQCGRGMIPQVVALPSYEEALRRASCADLAIVFYENEHSHTLHQALNGCAYSSVSLLTGPEGGFEDEEIRLAQNAGLEICTLGRRILRCETAPLCAVSAVMYQAGEF